MKNEQKEGGKHVWSVIPELIIVLIIALFVFGAGQISEIAGSIGKGVKSLKKSLKEPNKIEITGSASASI